MNLCSIPGCNTPTHARGWCQKHYRRVLRRGVPSTRTTSERFWAKVEKTESCWVWAGAKNPRGYGNFNVGKRGQKNWTSSHRFAYEELVGPIPAGLVVDHICHNTSCVNPAHLRAVTQAVNMQNREGPNSNSTTGYWGVSRSRNPKRFRAYINTPDGQINLGVYDTAEEAAKAAAQARAEHFKIPVESFAGVTTKEKTAA